ncbi:MAG: HAD family hydrolase [Gemmataceae bacterium]|jgi:putative hydrolase of the HAD superfamily|nr:HAD family hydrolase [Gemmataceae bacterium]
MLNPSVKAIYFDVVGTLFHPDPSVSEVYLNAAARHGVVIGEQAIRTRLKEAYIRQERIDHQNHWLTSEEREKERWYEIIREVMPEANPTLVLRELWDYFAQPSAWRLAEGAGEVLRSLSEKGIVVGLASNFDARLIDLARGFPELAPIGNRIVVSSLVGIRKPGKGFFDAVIQSAQFPPHQIVLVGDDLHNDIHGAKAAGLEPILFDPSGLSIIEPKITSLFELLE